MKYILTIIFSLALVTPVFASVTPWQNMTTGEGSNAGILDTGVTGILMSAPVASPPAGEYTNAQTITLSAPGSTEIRWMRNTQDLVLTCDSGNIYNSEEPISMGGSGLIRAVGCYGSNTGPLASLDYVITSSSEPASSGGGSTAGGGGGGSYTPPTAPPTTEQADFDDSGSVDILDFNILIINWGTTTGATKATGDADGNGTVDIYDFNILITNWSTA